jgi:hypothetical protein
MIYTLDTEFNAKGIEIKPLSLALVKITGEELYIEFAPAYSNNCNEFVAKNVVPNLKWAKEADFSFIRTNEEAREEIIAFTKDTGYGIDPGSSAKEDNQFYTWYGAYDWVLLSQVFDEMVNLPSNFPMYTRDLKYIVDLHKISKAKLPKQVNDNHNALEDARWNMEVYKYISTQTFLPV